MSFFKTNTTNDNIKPTSLKNVHGGVGKPKKLKIQKQSEEEIIKNIRSLFRLKKKMKQSKTE